MSRDNITIHTYKRSASPRSKTLQNTGSNATYIVGGAKADINKKIESNEEQHHSVIQQIKESVSNIYADVGNVIDKIKEKVTASIKEVKEQIDSKLSKTEADTAEEHITFAKGLTTLNAIIQQLAQIYQLSVDDVANIAKLVISGELKSDDYSNTDGFKIFRGSDGWNIEIDNVIARKTFKTLEHVVQRVVHQGGMIIQSPAGGTLVRYERENPAMWVFKVDSSEDFDPGDFVLCQTFSAGRTKRYWRLVDNYYPESKTIFINKNDREEGSDIPEVGDEIVVLGHKRNPARQNARIINVIGDNAPYTADYKGINDYTLQGKLINQIGNLVGVNDPAFGGNLSGVGIYTKNLYANGENIILQSGKSVEQALSADSIISTVKPTLDKRFGGEVIEKQVDLTNLDEDKFYPLMLWLNGQKRAKITVHRPLDWLLNRGPSQYQMSYSKHPTSGFMTLLEWEVTGSGWGAAPINRAIKTYSTDWLKDNEWTVGGIDQIYQLTCEMVYLRGGSKYNISMVTPADYSWIRRYFPTNAAPIQLYDRGFSYEQDIKNNPAFGDTEAERQQYFGLINYPIKSSVVEPKVTSEAKLEALESKITQKNDQIKLEIHNSVTEEVKSGLTVSENGLMLLGKQIVLAGTTLARNMVLQAIQAQKAEIARVISDDIIAKKIEVRKDGKEMALIDANTSTVRFGEGASIGDLIVNHNGLRCLNKEYKIESDYAGRGRVAHLSTWFNEPAVWAQADDDTAIVALSKNHSHKFQSNSTVVAIKGKGGVFFNTSQNDYWRMPGVLWIGRINKWGTVEAQWGDGIKNITINRIGEGVYRVSFPFGDQPQIYASQVVPYTNEYWSSAWINSVSDNNFTYETVDTGQGKRNMGVMLTIFGVPAIK